MNRERLAEIILTCADDMLEEFPTGLAQYIADAIHEELEREKVFSISEPTERVKWWRRKNVRSLLRFVGGD